MSIRQQQQRQPRKRLVILYGKGGLSDVGRHAIQVAVDQWRDLGPNDQKQSGKKEGNSSRQVEDVVVLTKHPDLLREGANWNCGCPAGAHDATTVDALSRSPRFRLVAVADWKDPDLRRHFGDDDDAGAGAQRLAAATTGTAAVISCLGNRQTVGHNDASEAMEHLVLPAMRQHGIARLVSITSMAVEEDRRCVVSCAFRLVAPKAFADLTRMERLVREAAADIDYLLVRPVGIGEGVVPQGRWQLGSSSNKKEKIGMSMAKLDVARFMFLEASVRPTLHRTAVVVGGVAREAVAQSWENLPATG
jgi:hypothetical protein